MAKKVKDIKNVTDILSTDLSYIKDLLEMVEDLETTVTTLSSRVTELEANITTITEWIDNHG